MLNGRYREREKEKDIVGICWDFLLGMFVAFGAQFYLVSTDTVICLFI